MTSVVRIKLKSGVRLAHLSHLKLEYAEAHVSKRYFSDRMDVATVARSLSVAAHSNPDDTNDSTARGECSGIPEAFPAAPLISYFKHRTQLRNAQSVSSHTFWEQNFARHDRVVRAGTA